MDMRVMMCIRDVIALMVALDQRFILTMVDLREQLNVMAIDMERSLMVLEYQEIHGKTNQSVSCHLHCNGMTSHGMYVTSDGYDWYRCKYACA
jgi:streptogramin lyase